MRTEHKIVAGIAAGLILVWAVFEWRSVTQRRRYQEQAATEWRLVVNQCGQAKSLYIRMYAQYTGPAKPNLSQMAGASEALRQIVAGANDRALHLYQSNPLFASAVTKMLASQSFRQRVRAERSTLKQLTAAEINYCGPEIQDALSRVLLEEQQ